MIHGRFQPFHLGHLDYLKTALSRCEHLIIGITNPDPAEFVEEKTSSHRHVAESNPYTYFQRQQMIKECLIDLEVDLNKISFIPFYLFNEEKWKYFIPNPENLIMLMRIYTEWEEKKIKRFENYGIKVEVLEKYPVKTHEGIHVRRMMKNNEDYKSQLPKGTIRVLDLIGKGML